MCFDFWISWLLALLQWMVSLDFSLSSMLPFSSPFFHRNTLPGMCLTSKTPKKTHTHLDWSSKLQRWTDISRSNQCLEPMISCVVVSNIFYFHPGEVIHFDVCIFSKRGLVQPPTNFNSDLFDFLFGWPPAPRIRCCPKVATNCRRTPWKKRYGKGGATRGELWKGRVSTKYGKFNLGCHIGGS